MEDQPGSYILIFQALQSLVVATPMRAEPAGDESGIKSLLIVDESLASGRTVAAVLEHLRTAGLPRDCAVYVAAAAWLNDEQRKSAV